MRSRLAHWALAGLFAGLVFGCAQEATVEGGLGEEAIVLEAFLEPASATVGDRVAYRLNIERPDSVELLVEAPGEKIGDLSVVEHSVAERRLARSRVLEQHSWILRADPVGSFVLPPVTVRQREESRLASGKDASISEIDPLYLEVYSVLPESGEIEDIHDLKALQPARWEVPWGWILAGIVVVALAIWWWRRRRRLSEAGVTPATDPRLPPDAEALAAIALLLRDPPRNEAEVRQTGFDLSGILRIYVERRFGVNATDLTSEEILAASRRIQLEEDSRNALRDFLRLTDQVRYSPEILLAGATDDAVELARRFVQATRQDVPEVAREAA